MKRISKFLPIALMGMLILTGCKKDGFVTFRATTQPYDGVGKMYIENDYACWSDGDQVKINSTTSTATVVNRNGDSYVELTGVSQASDYYAIYPASACAGTFGPSASITLPNVQTYRVENGHQVLSAPMAAMAYDRQGDGSRVLRFQNLCLILKVHIEQKNNVIKAIKLVNPDSNSNPVPLSGTGTVTFTGSNPAVPSLSMTSSQYNVTLEMDAGVSLNVSGGTDYYIAVPALANGVNLDIYTKDMSNETRKLTVTTHQELHSNTIVKVDGPTQLDNANYDFNYDWIQSVSSGYFDLGVTPHEGVTVEIVFSVPNLSSLSPAVTDNLTSTQTVFGSRGLSNGTGSTQWLTIAGAQGNVNNGFAAVFAGGGVARFRPADGTGENRMFDKKYRMRLTMKRNAGTHEYYGDAIFKNETDDTGPWTLTGVYSNRTTDLPTNMNTMYVFGLNTQELHKGMRLYSFQYYEGSTCVHNFLPCRRVSPEAIGVYDTKTGTFIEPELNPARSHDFSVGND